MESQLRELLSRWERLRREGRTVSAEELCADRPELIGELKERVRAIEQAAHGAEATEELEPPAALPAQFGRYTVLEKLGQGGFGAVYRGYDEQLQRPVAIKVLHPWRFDTPGGTERFLREGRHAAQLDHPRIVTVYDVGSAPHGSYIVYKLIEGSSLAARLRQGPMPHAQAAGLVAELADALDHAHRSGVYHRDIKPANILLDRAGKPYVADFGLAVREADLLRERSPRAGTYPYMAPEQVRGEGHRIDGRTDIYSLGVVLYELLTGQRPFEARSPSELFELILHREPRPPRQVEPSIPRELERICLSAMAKRLADRYTTAGDMAEELRQASHLLPREVAPGAGGPAPVAPIVATPGTASDSTRGTLSDLPDRIVPKGLRAFGPEDAEFFLELLPGPRNREGLPDSIRFWKMRIESRDLDGTFTVGLMYGPSGCGKSSLVRAGLLPRLAPVVRPVYVEATRDDTERRLARGLCKAFPALAPDAAFPDMVAALRRWGESQQAPKVLIVLDQFEQWLHARGGERDAELVRALRQCDGEHVQCLLLVRDDFWLAVSRFMRELEVTLVEGSNITLVDLFDVPHARKVLAAFGRAYGRLPDHPTEITPEQGRFLDQAVAGLARDDKVIPVQLSLFAEMLKGKPWTAATLREVGGIEGVGATFLEETFGARTANPDHRRHQQAARMVLRALLPEQATDIKGHMRSRAELLAASGYEAQPGEFDRLLRILDTALRLITPVDPQGSITGQEGGASGDSGHYQLTHDYLVRAVREWLAVKQRQTLRGRAELRLAEWAALWGSRPHPRNLPPLWSWLAIVLLTRERSWNSSEHAAMRAAARRHALHVALWGLLACGLAAGAWTMWKPIHARQLVQRLDDVAIAQVPGIVAQMKGYGRWVNPTLREALDQSSPSDRRHLYASLALLPDDPGQVPYLHDRLLAAEPTEVAVLCDALLPHHAALDENLWEILKDPNAETGRSLHAACALAAFAPADPRWNEVIAAVVAQLVAQNELVVGQWAELLRPVQASLIEPLRAVFADALRPAERYAASLVLASYLADQPAALLELLDRADPRQVATLSNALAARRSTASDRLRRKLSDRPTDLEGEANGAALAQARANAAIALLLLGEDEHPWRIAAHSSDPSARTELLHRLVPAGVKPQVVLQRLQAEPDPSARRTLVLALGEFRARIAPAQQRELIDQLLDMYRRDPDPGLHSAAEWVLRLWQQENRLAAAEAELAEPGYGQHPGRAWYINSQRQTFAIVRGPVRFRMGAPDNEAGRLAYDEEPHDQEIRESFAIGTREVTVREFLEFRPDHPYDRMVSPELDCPINSVNLADAVEYCRWLSEQESIPDADADYGYRLPTEAEWEYACRAGTVTPWSFGRSAARIGAYGWHAGNSNNRTHPVAMLKPNDLGLFDVHGNIMEWVEDTPITAEELQTRDWPAAPADLGPNRVLRGGWKQSPPPGVRSAYRNPPKASLRFREAGFRLARSLGHSRQAAND